MNLSARIPLLVIAGVSLLIGGALIFYPQEEASAASSASCQLLYGDGKDHNLSQTARFGTNVCGETGSTYGACRDKCGVNCVGYHTVDYPPCGGQDHPATNGHYQSERPPGAGAGNPATLSFSGSPKTVGPGQTFTITWRAGNGAAWCNGFGHPSFQGAHLLNGSFSTSFNQPGTYGFGMVCSNGSPPNPRSSVSIQVTEGPPGPPGATPPQQPPPQQPPPQQPPPQQPPPQQPPHGAGAEGATLSFSGSPTTVGPGQTFTIKWKAGNGATWCNRFGDPSFRDFRPPNPLSGSFSTSFDKPGKHGFGVICGNGNPPNAMSSVTIQVLVKPPGPPGATPPSGGGGGAGGSGGGGGAGGNTQCTDGKDNDGDGKIDGADPGCLDSSGSCKPSDNNEFNLPRL